MSAFPDHSRRALIGATAAWAAAPVTKAKKKGKGKKKPPAPLAHAVARVTALSSRSGSLLITFDGFVEHVASGNGAGFAESDALIPYGTTSAALVAKIQSVAASVLEPALAVPVERIAVTLL
jgi:hypothetical protein